MKRDEIQRELEQIRKENDGLLKAEMVVEYASDPNSAMHSWFTWEDTEAAEQWRLHEARMLIRINITMVQNEEESLPMRIYVSMETDRYNGDGGGYRSMEEVLTDVQLRDSLLSQAAREFDRWKAKYEHLTELAEVFAAMERVSVTI
jgi:hypothetical protein